MKRVVLSLMGCPLLVAATIQSAPDLGTTEGRCRPNELGPSFLVDVEGLKDRSGKLKLEVYPANDPDFLEDDNVLISTGRPSAGLNSQSPLRGRCVSVSGFPPRADMR